MSIKFVIKEDTFNQDSGTLKPLTMSYLFGRIK